MRVIIAMIMALIFPTISFAVVADDYEGGSAKPDTFYDRTPPDKNFVDIPELTRTGRNLAKKLQAEEGFDISLEEVEQFVAYAGRSKHQAYILTLFHLSAAKGNPEWRGNGDSGILAIEDDLAPDIGGQCGLLSYEDLLKIGNNVCAADRTITMILNNIEKNGIPQKIAQRYPYLALFYKEGGGKQNHSFDYQIVFHSIYRLSNPTAVFEKFKSYEKIGALIKE